MSTSHSFRKAFDSLQGRNYIVTGGGQGIGFTIAKAIAEFGGNVAIVDLRQIPVQEYDQLASEFKIRTEYYQCDVSKEESLTSAFENVVKDFGQIHGLVTSAGIAIDKPFVEQTWQEAEKIQQVNVSAVFVDQQCLKLTHRQVLGTFFATQLASKQMIKQGTGGSIVLIASITAHVALPGFRMAAYNASKGGVHMMSKALAVELAPKGIRVNSISPGFIDSEQTKVARDGNPSLPKNIMDSAPPAKRIGTQEDVAGAAVYLLSDAASYTCGADIAVTGALHLGRQEVNGIV